MALMASTRSRIRPNRLVASVPWLAISSTFQPAPTPNRNRPPERWSTDAASLAVMMGSRSTTRQMPVPTLSSVVTMAAAVQATNGSSVWLYSGGSSPPAGYGVSRLTGMWVCSGNSSESKPACSTSGATSCGGAA